MHKSRFWVFVMCMVVLSASLSGCEPLRKKFTKKKKEAKEEEFIPILDPIDYPPSRISAVEKYRYHYSLWQVWNKDLMQQLGEPRTMEKRRNYLFTEIIQQLQEMKRWIPQESLPKLDEALSAYDGFRKELEKPAMTQNQSVLESRLRHAEKFIMKELKPDVIFTEEEQEAP